MSHYQPKLEVNVEVFFIHVEQTDEGISCALNKGKILKIIFGDLNHDDNVDEINYVVQFILPESRTSETVMYDEDDIDHTIFSSEESARNIFQILSTVLHQYMIFENHLP